MRNILSVFCVVMAGAAAAQQAADAVEPEAGGAGVFEGLPAGIAGALEAKAAGVPVVASDWMVAAANPHAVKAGADVLAEELILRFSS